MSTTLDTLLGLGPFLLIVFVREVFSRLFHIKLEVVLAVLVYAMIRIIYNLFYNMYRSTRRLFRYQSFHVPQPKVATNASEINSIHRLKGLEVVLGYQANRPVKIDVRKPHTIISGATGSGKTNCLHLILLQLLQRGELVRSKYEVHLFDLKSSDDDYLWKWESLLDGYYPIDPDGGARGAVNALDRLANRITDNDSDKEMVIIIDEFAMFTNLALDREEERAAKALLRRVAAQIRNRGCLIAATQRVHFEIIERNVSVNFGRKITFRTDDADSARMTLRHRPDIDVSSLKDGEFLMKDPSLRARETMGRTILVDIPSEIDGVVFSQVAVDGDIRMELFRTATAGKQAGNDLHGINKVRKSVDITAANVAIAYRNYALAGLTEPNLTSDGSKVSSYKLLVAPEKGYEILRDYIAAGRWKAAPAPLAENEDE